VIEKEHYVPLRTRYWDDVGVEVKELRSPRASLKAYDGVWVPTESTMTDLLEDTKSTAHVDTVDPNPTLADSDFSRSARSGAPSSRAHTRVRVSSAGASAGRPKDRSGW
jgi:hypothetical protein